MKKRLRLADIKKFWGMSKTNKLATIPRAASKATTPIFGRAVAYYFFSVLVSHDYIT
jgi:hypothetical protein